MTDDVTTSTSIQPAPASTPAPAPAPAPASTPAPVQEEDQEEGAMSIWDHLNELRKRLFIGALAMVVTSGLSFVFAEQIIALLAIPLGGMQNFLSIEVTENLGVFMRVSLLSGFIFALPIVLYEVLAFIMPGLTETEQKWVYMSIPFATILFLAGVSFSYFIILPTSIPFLIGFLGIKTTPRPSVYIDFVTGLMFWVGAVFEMPLVMFMLAKLGIVKASWLLKGWRYALVIIAVVAAVITPTSDPINMGILMVPLIALYFMSVGLAAIAGRNPTRTPKER
jgi:sec-independent protein translocase protein TatC